MRKLYFTIGVKANDIEIPNSNLAERVNIGELFNRYPETLFHVPNQKLVAILKYIDNSSGDVLIANVADSFDSYTSLRKEIMKRDAIIDRVFIKIPIIIDKELDDMYNNSQLKVYSREELKLLAIDYQQSIKTLAEQIKMGGDKVIKIKT